VPSLLRIKASPVQRQVRCRVSVRIQTRAVPWMKAREDYWRPTTAPNIEWERRSEASDGNDAVRDMENRIHQLNSRDGCQHGMSLHRSDNTDHAARTKNEGPRRRPRAITLHTRFHTYSPVYWLELLGIHCFTNNITLLHYQLIEIHGPPDHHPVNDGIMAMNEPGRLDVGWLFNGTSHRKVNLCQLREGPGSVG